MAGKIIKAKNQTNFVQMHNEIARSPIISMKAKAMLLVLLSLPENWVIHIEQLTDYFKESKNTVRSAFKELQVNGFILSVENRSSTGRFKGVDYLVYAESQKYIELSPTSPENKEIHPYTKKPHTDSPHADKRALQINISRKKEKKNKYTTNSKENFSVFYGYDIDDLNRVIGVGGTIKRDELTEEQHNWLLEDGYKLDKEQKYFYPE